MQLGNAVSLDLSIVIPSFNNPLGLLDLVSRLEAEFEDDNFEIVVVDDASINQGELEDAWVARFGKSQSRKLFSLSRNVGQLRATWIGLGKATGKVVVTMDDDGQHDPFEVRTLIKALESDSRCDFAMAGFSSNHASFLRRGFSELNRRLTVRSLDTPPTTKFSSFMAVTRGFLDHCLSVEDPDAPRPRWMFESSLHFCNPTIDHSPRSLGKSSYSARKLIAAASQTAIGLVTSAFSAFVILGIAISSVAFFWSVYTFFIYWTGGITVDGYLSTNVIASMTLFLNSFLFSMISYLAKSNLPLTRARLPMSRVHEKPLGRA